MVSLIPRPRDVSSRRIPHSTIPPPPRQQPSTKTKASSVPSAVITTGGSRHTTTRAQAPQQPIDRSLTGRRDAHSSTTVTDGSTPAGETFSTVRSPTSASANVLRHKRPLISDYVKKRRESPPESGPGSLSIQIPDEVPSVRPSQHYTYSDSKSITSPVQSPSRNGRSREIPEDLRHVFQAPTPLSEISATPSLRHDSPSIFSQISPSSVTTPTSLGGYSPQVSQRPHFGPEYSTKSPVGRAELVGVASSSPWSTRGPYSPQPAQRYQVHKPAKGTSLIGGNHKSERRIASTDQHRAGASCATSARRSTVWHREDCTPSRCYP